VQVKDKLAVVTGGAVRLGRAIAEGLAADGAHLVIHCHRSIEDARSLARSLNATVIQADLARPEGAVSLADQVLALGRELGVWVNAAADFERVAFAGSDDGLWQRTMQLVVLSPASMVRRVAPAMVDGGVVINVLDVAARQPWRGYAHHCTAKAALGMLTRSLALELAPRLRVCGVSPGLILPAEGDDVSRLLRRIPLGRRGRPDDVVSAIRFLVEADYVTGTVVEVDGGLGAR
jgi:pteridine reductase